MILFEHLADLLSTDMIGCNLGTDISDDLIWGTDIPPDHIHDRLVEYSPLVKFYERDEKSLFKDIMVV